MHRDEGFKITESLPGTDVVGSPKAAEPVVPPAAEAPVRIGTAETATRMGRHLAEQLEEQGYHPVVVFGSSNSGKSSMLASLLAYLQVDQSAGVEIRLGDPIAVEDQAYGQWAHNEALGFFNRSVQEFLGGKAHAKTISPNPFFIPVILRPHGNLPEAKFAFLEGNGEWYQPDEQTDAYFKPLKEEISGVLRHFQKGISFLHIAPFTQVAQWQEGAPPSSQVEAVEMKKAELGLKGAIGSYNDVRIIKHRDAHLFLVTKWDVFSPPGASDGAFSAPTLEEVVGVASRKYQQSYAAFQNMNIGGAGWQKQIMQYCSGIISGREILKATAENKQQLDRYPRALWNWLYANATRDQGQVARALFPKPPVAGLTVAEKFNKLVGRSLRWLGV